MANSNAQTLVDASKANKDNLKYPKTNQIEHIDGNKHNNKIDNLRPCKPSENSMNIGTRKNNAIGIKNVQWEKSRKKWRVRIHANGSMVYCGRFDNLEAATKAATESRNKYHGAYANHGV